MISVTVPVYNEADSLPILAERVTSVLGKLGQPWELIFINDGSHDGSEEVLDQIATENPAAASVSATPRPSPREEPVTRATGMGDDIRFFSSNDFAVKEKT